MQALYFSKKQVLETFPDRSWQAVLFAEFAAALTSEARPFPCIFGVNGFRSDQLRFAFPEPLSANTLGSILRHYLGQARGYGPNTSLVVFSRPTTVQPIDTYATALWTLLRDLARADPTPWPCEIPETIDSPLWEFCFAGEPIFVVCNTPAHVMRQSRRSSSFMLTFQPRWVFDNILGTERAAETATRKVRHRLRPYDLMPPSPALGSYGDSNNREFAQYFLRDDNGPARCPFTTLRADCKGDILLATIKKARADVADFKSLIMKALPDQGCIEVQRDVPGKEHSWHKHKVDETIVVLDGCLRFYWEEGERVCFPGDVISLPAETPHGSQALDKGATYLIAFNQIGL